MSSALRALPTLLCVSLLGPSLAAQSFNLDIGAANTSVPASTYGGAGLAGTWNAVVLPHTTPSQAPQAFDELLVGLDGLPTAVRIHQFGGQAWVNTADAALSGDDASLLDDALVTHSLGLDSCLYLNGLQNGLYEVITYMWMPNHPEVVHKSLFDTVPGTQTTNGAWTGSHAEGISYTRTLVNVTNGFMGPHAGLAPGGDAGLGGAINGMQIRLIECTSASYCSSGPNSTGSAALISSNSACSVSQNSFSLSAGPTPNTVGLFFYSTSASNGGAGVPFGNGLRCVGGGTGIFRLPASSISGNSLTHDLDFGAQTLPAGQITPGSTWYFQAWFRDPVAGGSLFDLSDGLEMTFDA